MLSDPRRLAIALAGICCFINLYATQPLLPLFAREFHATSAQVSMTVSATTLAVALVAPFIGVVADLLGRKRIIVAALTLLVVPTVLIALSSSLAQLVVWRFMQGLCLPPIFAVIVAYIGDEWPREEVTGVTSLYMAASGIGGFLGRLLTGFMADHWGWRAAFWTIAAITLVSAVVVGLALSRERRFVRAENLLHSLQMMLAHLGNTELVTTFVVGFATLFSFVATFTYVNFYLAAPPFELPASALGTIFVVYLVAVAVTPLTGGWIRRLGRRLLVVVSSVCWCLGLLITLVPWLPAIVVGLTILACAGFTCQTTATSLLAERAIVARSSAVGIYVSCYYIGGSVGAVAPAAVWAHAGWPGCVALVSAVMLAMAALAARFWRPTAGSSA
jgi:MFS transporter, YNFM family, putative membrane transport protein